jgi:hypothetical protein
MMNDDQEVEAKRAVARARAYAANAWASTRDEAEARFHALLDRAEKAWSRRPGAANRSLRGPLAAVAVIGAAIGLGLYLSQRSKSRVMRTEPVDGV